MKESNPAKPGLTAGTTVAPQSQISLLTAIKGFLRSPKFVFKWLALPVVLGLACELQFFNLVQFDDFCELRQFGVLSGVVSKPVRLELVGAGDLRQPGFEVKRRLDYANLIKKLSKNKASLVLFDLYFVEPDGNHLKEEKEFATAIKTHSSDASFNVLIGEPGEHGKMSAALEDAAGPMNRGSLLTGGERNIWGTPYLRRFILAEQWVDGPATRMAGGPRLPLSFLSQSTAWVPHPFAVFAKGWDAIFSAQQC